MFGINKVTGRGRQTIEALKNQQGDGVTSSSGVLSKAREDKQTFNHAPDTDYPTHSHTFRLGNSTGALFTFEHSENFQYGCIVYVMYGNNCLLEYAINDTLKLTVGLEVSNSFLRLVHTSPVTVDIGNINQYVSYPITQGENGLGDITVMMSYDGDPADDFSFESSIKVNFN